MPVPTPPVLPLPAPERQEALSDGAETGFRLVSKEEFWLVMKFLFFYDLNDNYLGLIELRARA